MAAPKGNRFWEARSSFGRKPKFETPDILWQACCEYFKWVEDNPLWETKTYQFKALIMHDTVPKMRAMTIGGLCIFLDISHQTWLNYRARDEYVGVVARVEDIIRTQKFEGAAAELFNPNIIARHLGLRESVATEVSGNVKQEFSLTGVSDESLRELLAAVNGSATDNA